jgi:hypothetical protein
MRQNIKNDEGKPKLSLVPPEIGKGIAYVREYGAAKYKNEDGTPNHDNWKEVDPPERWLDACLRHLTAHAWGEKKDPESGLSHLAHAACSLAYLMECESGTNRRAASPPRGTAEQGFPAPEGFGDCEGTRDRACFRFGR